MLDFKELPIDGNDLELLIREILLIKGYRVQWSGKGPDGGKDLLCFEERDSEFLKDKKTWLIQCKHNAHNGSSAGVNDLDDIVDCCTQHNADGFLLVCSTFPSSAVINRLEGISNNPSNNITATYWDATRIEQTLSTANLWTIAQRFFPVSSKKATWEIYATTNPNHWVVNYRGYHFHLTNRIGSTSDYHFRGIDDRINEIEKFKLSEGHFIRIRAIYFDDKNGGYTWFLDYMYPHNEEPDVSRYFFTKILGNDSALDDGQFYSFDVIPRPYYPNSDHYDKDHYNYYKPFQYNFSVGAHRHLPETYKNAKLNMWTQVPDFATSLEQPYDLFLKKLKLIPGIHVVRSVDAAIEYIDKFHKLNDWSHLVKIADIEIDRFFSAWFFLEVENEAEILKALAFFPQTIECSFRFTKPFIFIPNDGFPGCFHYKEENTVYELTFTLHPSNVNTIYIARHTLNNYFENCCLAIDTYLENI